MLLVESKGQILWLAVVHDAHMGHGKKVRLAVDHSPDESRERGV
jgi:hypothetical protein